MALISDVGFARYEWREDFPVLEQIEVLIADDGCGQTNFTVSTRNNWHARTESSGER